MPPKTTKKRRYVHCRCTVFGCCDGPNGSTWVTYDTARGHTRRQKFDDTERAAERAARQRQQVGRAPAPAPAPTPAPARTVTPGPTAIITTTTTTADAASLPPAALAPSTSTAIGTKKDSNVGK